MHRGGGKGEVGSAYELLAPGRTPGELGPVGAPGPMATPAAADPDRRPGPTRSTGASATSPDASLKPTHPAPVPLHEIRREAAADPVVATAPPVRPAPPSAPGGVTADPTVTAEPVAAPDLVVAADSVVAPDLVMAADSMVVPDLVAADSMVVPDSEATCSESEARTTTAARSEPPVAAPESEEPGPKAALAPTQSDPKGRRRAGRKAVTAIGVVAVIVVLVALVMQPWHGAQATRTRSGTHQAGAHRSSLAFTPRADAVQPPPTSDPSAPGQLVDSGENRSDPFLFLTGGRYYLYTSGTTVIPFLNVPVASTTDFKTWTPPIDAMPHLPPWAAEPFTWGPDVHQFGSTYVLYFTAVPEGAGRAVHRGGVSSLPGRTLHRPTPPVHLPVGPSRAPSTHASSPIATAPATCSSSPIRTPTEHHARPPVVPEARAERPQPARSPSALMNPDEPWQGTIIEAPDLVLIHGVYWLAYSANWFNQPRYGIGVAWCKGPSGPCADLSSDR